MALFALSLIKKTLIKFGIGFGSIILFLIIYYAILNPIVKEKKLLYKDKISKQNEIEKFEKSIVSSKKTINKLKPEFEKNSKSSFLEVLRRY